MIIVSVAMLPIIGRWVDRFGERRLLFNGVCLAVLATVPTFLWLGAVSSGIKLVACQVLLLLPLCFVGSALPL